VDNSTRHNDNQIANQIETELLVLRCQDGELDAFRELVDDWQIRLFRFVFRLTENREASADVTQECWLAVVRGIRKLNDPALFRAWLFRIAANKCADWIRQEQRARKTNDELSAEVGSEKIDYSAIVDSGEEFDEITQLRRALRKLPSEQRKILNMRYLDGIKTDEIAHALAIPAGTVKSRLHHARKALRALIDKTIAE
jgi:RNA polymerase sigma factor (sigma-70 family)